VKEEHNVERNGEIFSEHGGNLEEVRLLQALSVLYSVTKGM